MNALDLAAGIAATLIGAVLWMALWNEICVEIRARGKAAPIPIKALTDRYTVHQRSNAEWKGPAKIGILDNFKDDPVRSLGFLDGTLY